MRALVVLMLVAGVAGAAPPKKPPQMLVIAIDRSGSMQGPKLDAAKAAVAAAAKALGPDGQVAVVAFDSEAEVFVPLQRVGDGLRLAKDVARLQSGGGTNVFPGLDVAYHVLETHVHELAWQAHVLVITDGHSPTDGIRELTSMMTDVGITVSAIGLGADADPQLLSTVTEAGNGRVYFIESAGGLDDVVTSDVEATFGRRGPVPSHGAVVLIVDRSGSLSDHEFLSEKRAVNRAIRTLAPTDQVAVIAFDSEGVVWSPLHRVGDGSLVLAQLATLKQQGGTNVFAALHAAHGLEHAHVVLLTDGDARPDGVAELAGAFDDLSVIGIGKGGDRALLAGIAGRGGGRVWFVDDPDALSGTVGAWLAATSGASSR